MGNSERFAIGCDIGGSHISCAILDIDSGSIWEDAIVNVKVSHSEPKEVLLQSWSKAISDCQKRMPEKTKIKGIGLAIPDPFDYEKGIGLYDNSNLKFVDLKNVNIKEALSNSLSVPSEQIRFINDATAFSLGCYWYGSGKGSNRMVAITLGTGFGSSFVADGVAVEEGETVPPDGYLWDKPYKEGIADDYFSTRWFVDSFNNTSEKKVTGVKPIADMAREGDKRAVEVFGEFGSNLADCLAQHLKNFNADTVVMGGNIAEAFDLLKPSLYKTLEERGLSIPFKVSVLKEKAAMLGAATLFKEG